MALSSSRRKPTGARLGRWWQSKHRLYRLYRLLAPLLEKLSQVGVVENEPRPLLYLSQKRGGASWGEHHGVRGVGDDSFLPRVKKGGKGGKGGVIRPYFSRGQAMSAAGIRVRIDGRWHPASHQWR